MISPLAETRCDFVISSSPKKLVLVRQTEKRWEEEGEHEEEDFLMTSTEMRFERT